MSNKNPKIIPIRESYFSINYDLISVGQALGFDLYVNSSSLVNKERFIKVFRGSEVMEVQDKVKLKLKYIQLYVPEIQRNQFLQSLVHSDTFTDIDKTEVIKDSALKYLHNIFDSGREFSTELLSETIEGCREIVESMVDVLDDHNVESLHELIGSLSFHDFYTYDHSINVSMYCIAILKEVKPEATRQELMQVGLGGLLHDLGKIKIPTEILNNPGKLTDYEYQEIKKHPSFGLELLMSGHCEVDKDVHIETIARVIHEHHENWDGTGYPKQIAGEDISFYARICTVADFFDAITTKRSYNEVLSIDSAIEIMSNSVGKKLDPNIFDIFTRKVKKIVMNKKTELVLADYFDPTLPYEKLPLEKIKVVKDKEDFGKIKVMDDLGFGKKKKAG